MCGEVKQGVWRGETGCGRVTWKLGRVWQGTERETESE